MRVCCLCALSLKGSLKMKCLDAHPSLMTTGGGYWPDSSRMGTGPRPCSQYTGHLCLPSAALLPLSQTHTHIHTHSQQRDREMKQGREGLGDDRGPTLIGAPNKSHHCFCLYPSRSFVKQCQIMSNTVTQRHALSA